MKNNKLDIITPGSRNFRKYHARTQIKHNQTVNHDVTGSSPVGGATKAVEFISTAFFMCKFVGLCVNSWGKTVKRKDIWSTLYEKAKKQYHPEDLSPFVMAYHDLNNLKSLRISCKIKNN